MTLTKQVFRMTIQEFKQEATRRGNTYDNSSKASENWSRCWGLGYWWRDLWFYKEYRLGNMIYRTGRVRRRHCSYSVEERIIDGQTVDTRHFNKALKDFQAPALSSDEQTYIKQQELRFRETMLRPQKRTATRRRSNRSTAANWPTLPFTA